MGKFESAKNWGILVQFQNIGKFVFEAMKL